MYQLNAFLHLKPQDNVSKYIVIKSQQGRKQSLLRSWGQSFVYWQKQPPIDLLMKWIASTDNVCTCVYSIIVTLTLQNTLLGKAGGSKRPQKWSQTLLVHLLVSSPINISRLPVRHTLKKQSDEQVHKYYSKWGKKENNIIFFCNVICLISCRDFTWTYWEDSESLSGTFTQQFIQLLFGEGAHNKTKDE